MTKKNAATTRDPALSAVRAAWGAAHAPNATISAGLEAERWIARYFGAPLTEGQKAALTRHNLEFVSEATDGVHRSVIVRAVGKLAAIISVATAAKPEPIPAFVVTFLANAIEANADVANREAIIDYISATPAAVMALNWIREEHGRYDDAAALARAEADNRREVRAAKAVQTMPAALAIDEPPSSADDTTPIPAIESDSNLLAQKAARLEEQLKNATAALDKAVQVAVARQEVIDRQTALLEQLKSVVDQQSDKLRELVMALPTKAAPQDSASIAVDQGYISLPLPEMTTEKGRPSEWGALKIALGGEWRIVYEQIDFANRRYFARVERHHVTAPAEPIRRAVEPLPFMRIVEERGSISSDQIAAQWMGRAVERAEEIAAAAPQVAPMVVPANPFEAEGEVA